MNQTGNVEADVVARTDPFDSLWRFFSSTKLAIVLILLVAAASFIGAIIIQAPQEVLGDPTAYGQWLAAIQNRYGPLTRVYSALGLFNVYHVWWFTILLLVLIFNTIICTINRLPALWSGAFSPRVRVNEAMFRSAPIRASIDLNSPGERSAGQRAGINSSRYGIEDLAEVTFNTLAANRYKVFLERDGGTTHFYADRYGIFKLGTLLTHLSLVILMVGTVMGGMFGFSDDGVIIPEGQTYQVPLRGSDSFLVRADKFEADFYNSGLPKDYFTDVTVIDGGKEVLKQRIRVNEPLEYKGVRFHQSFYGPAPIIQVSDASGKILYSNELPLASQSATSQDGWIGLPGGDATMIVSLPFANTGSTPLAIQLYKGETVQNRDFVKPSESKTIGDYQVTYRSLAQFTGLRVVKDPGVPVVWFAAALLVLGICITLYFPRRRIWGRVTGQEVQLAGTADKSVNFRPEFDKLVEAIRRN